MREVEICHGTIIVKVVLESPQPRIEVRATDPEAPIASFPTDLSLLVGVAQGYSYQVGLPVGTLTMFLDNDFVHFKFDGKELGQKNGKTGKHEFQRAISVLNQ